MITFLGFPFEKDIIGFLLWIDSIGYSIFSTILKLFLNLAQYRIFDLEDFKTVYDNVYVIVGVVALFVISFMLLQMMINPTENKGAKQIKDIIIRFATAMGAIVLLPTFFGFLMDFQNSLISYGVLPNILLNNDLYVQQVDENGNKIGEPEKQEFSTKDLSEAYMGMNSNIMIAQIVGGLMYPLNEDGTYIKGQYDEDKKYTVFLTNEGKEWETNVTEWWDSGTETGWTIGGCVVGGIGAGLLMLIPVVRETAGVTLGGLVIAGCFGGAVITNTTGSVIAAIDSDHYTWTNALQAVERGDFSKISLFAQAVADGSFHYTAVISTVVIGFLIYIMLGFCIDVVVRSAKLFFYQLLGPLCFLMSVIPSKKDLMTKWLKLVFSVWLEIFIRVGAVCLIVLLVGKMDFSTIVDWMHPIASTFIILGFVTFVKQIPKLFKDLTGIDSGGMKLGLKEKIAEGGGFTAGAILGGGITAGTRNLINKWGNKENWKDKQGNVTFGSIAKNVGAGLLSSGAGTLSGGFRSGKAGLNAKSAADMKTSASKGAQGATGARDKRANYKAAHGGTIVGSLVGHATDAFTSIENWATDSSIEGLTKESNSMGKIASSYNAFNDTIENLLEKEQAKGKGTVFTAENGFAGKALTAYKGFDFMAQQRRAVQAAFNSGQSITYSYAEKDPSTGKVKTDKNGKVIMKTVTGKIDASTLAMIEGQYVEARDAARDAVMDISLAGSGDGTAYANLTAKGQAALKDSLVNAESLQATILENANTEVVQSVMGVSGNGALGKIINGGTIDHTAFEHGKGKDKQKLKDAAKVAQGRADIKIAEMNKEKAAKGDK